MIIRKIISYLGTEHVESMKYFRVLLEKLFFLFSNKKKLNYKKKKPFSLRLPFVSEPNRIAPEKEVCLSKMAFEGFGNHTKFQSVRGSVARFDKK